MRFDCARSRAFFLVAYEKCRLRRTGVSNKVIARYIGVTNGTVKAHLNRIYRKLGARNRAKLIVCFYGQSGEKGPVVIEQ